MGYDFIGRNPGTGIELGYSHSLALKAVLAALSGKEPDFLHPVGGRQCKTWAKLLRDNYPRVKLIEGVNKKIGLKGREYGFLVVQGTDIKREFKSGHYKNQAIDFEPSWNITKDPDGIWKVVLDDFITFLDSCGGIAEVG